MNPDIGQRIGNYHVVRKLREGGTGVVFEAMHRISKERAAILLVNPEFLQDQSIGTRLFHDVCGTQLLSSRSIVSVFEVGLLPDGGAYMAMEYLQGNTLAQRLGQQGTAFSGTAALSWVFQIAQLLAAAHKQGLVHGDLRPDNVMLVADETAPSGERVKLLNFGLPRLTDISGLSEVLARSGMAYLSPEQRREAEPTSQADVYSLGALLFHLLSGRPPQAAPDHEPVPLRDIDASIPEELDELVQQMLHNMPAERPVMAQVAARLRHLLLEQGEPMEPEPAPSARPVPVLAPPPARRLRLPKAGVGTVAMSFLAGVLTTLLWVQRNGPADRDRARPADKAPARPVVAKVVAKSVAKSVDRSPLEPPAFPSVGSVLDAGPLPALSGVAPERPRAVAQTPEPTSSLKERSGPPIPPLRLFEPGGRRSRSRHVAAVKAPQKTDKQAPDKAPPSKPAAEPPAPPTEEQAP